MAFCAQSLITAGAGPVGQASGLAASGRPLSSHEYRTADAAATVETAGYFNGARTRLQVGDVITAIVGVGATMKGKHYVVTAVPVTGDVTIGLFATTAG